MARARNIKPGFFTNEDLVECSFAARLLFPGLWMLADREGRLEDRPKKIKMTIFPADNVDIDELLNELGSRGFIKRYTADGKKVISIPTFHEHQNPHSREQDSVLPDEDGFYKVNERNKDLVTGKFVLVKSLIGIDSYADAVQAPDQHHASPVQAPDQHHASPADSLNPESPILNPDTYNPPIPPEEEKIDAPSEDGLVCIDSSFDVFWQAYPNKTAKEAARKAFKKIKKPAETVGKILEALDWQVDTDKWKRGFIPNPATYLNGGCWQDERPPPAHHPPSNINKKFDAFDYNNGGDGYGNPRKQQENRIIDITDCVDETGGQRKIGYRSPF